MHFDKDDKIYCDLLEPHQYYMLAYFDTGLLGWSCDLYEDGKVIKTDIELNLDMPKYYKKDD